MADDIDDLLDQCESLFSTRSARSLSERKLSKPNDGSITVSSSSKYDKIRVYCLWLIYWFPYTYPSFPSANCICSLDSWFESRVFSSPNYWGLLDHSPCLLECLCKEQPASVSYRSEQFSGQPSCLYCVMMLPWTFIAFLEYIRWHV